jgi:hypothetical protein
MNSDGTLIGHLGVVDDTGFVLEPDKRGEPRHELKFTEVKSVHLKMKTWLKRAIAVGAVWVGLVIIGSRV